MGSYRTKQWKRGKKTLERVCKNLSTQKTLFTIPSGTNGAPDLTATINGTKYALEVKGMYFHYQRRTRNDKLKLNNLDLPKQQWVNLVKFSIKNSLQPAVLVELKTRSKRVPNLYFLLTKKAINILLKSYKGSWISASPYEIIDLGQRLFSGANHKVKPNI